MTETFTPPATESQGHTPSRSGLWPPWAYYWLLAIPALLKCIGQENVLLGRSTGCELTETHFYLQWMLSHELRKGFPLWNPWFACGYPLLGDWRLGLFHPFTLLHFVLPPHWVINVVLTAGVALSASTMYALARQLSFSRFGAWLSGVAYGFSGYAAGYGWLIGEYNHSLTYPFVPLVASAALGVVRSDGLRPICVGALVWALVLSGSNPPLILFSLLLWFSFAGGGLWEKRQTQSRGTRVYLALLVSLFLGTLITLPHLQSAWHLWQQTANKIPLENAKDYPFDRVVGESLLALISPSFFGDEANSLYWGRLGYAGALGYVGVSPFVFAVLSLFHVKRRRLAIALAIGVMLSLLLASETLGLFGQLANIPGWVQAMRAPARWLFLFVFCASLAGGLGWDAAVSWHPVARRRTGYTLLALVAVALLLLWLFFGRSTNGGLLWRNFVSDLLKDPFSALPPDLVGKMLNNEKFFAASFVIAWDSMLRTMLMFGGVACVLAFGFRASSHARAATLPLAGIFIATDVVGFFHSLESIEPAEENYFTQPIAHYVREQTGRDWRVLAPADTDFCLRPLRLPSRSLWARHTFVYKNLLDLVRVQERQPSYYVPGLMVSRVTPLTDFMSGRVVVTRLGTRLDDTWLSRTLTTQTTDVYLSRASRPRAAVARHVKLTTNPVEILFSVTSLDYQPTATVYLDPGNHILSTMDLDCNSPPNARITAEDGHSVTIELDSVTSKPVLLTLSDTYDPWWRATTDEKPTIVHKVNYGFRGVVVPAGHQIIRFEYQPPGWPITLWFSALLLGLTVFGALWPGRVHFTSEEEQ